MKTDVSAIFDINIVGDNSGNPYNGTFKVRTLLTRRQVALADEMRRSILGPSPEGATARVAMDAFVSGQLYVRVLEAPEWFKNSGQGGIDLPDINVLEEIFSKAIDSENARRSALLKESDQAATALKEKEEKK